MSFDNLILKIVQQIGATVFFIKHISQEILNKVDSAVKLRYLWRLEVYPEVN